MDHKELPQASDARSAWQSAHDRPYTRWSESRADNVEVEPPEVINARAALATCARLRQEFQTAQAAALANLATGHLNLDCASGSAPLEARMKTPDRCGVDWIEAQRFTHEACEHAERARKEVEDAHGALREARMALQQARTIRPALVAGERKADVARRADRVPARGLRLAKGDSAGSGRDAGAIRPRRRLLPAKTLLLESIPRPE